MIVTTVFGRSLDGVKPDDVTRNDIRVDPESQGENAHNMYYELRPAELGVVLSRELWTIPDLSCS